MKDNTVKSILKTGLPLLASQMSHYLMNVADTAMVGRIGVQQLAAISMASLFFYILGVLVWPVSIGSQALSARRFGKQIDAPEAEQEKLKVHTGEILDNGIVTGLTMGLVGIAAVSVAPFILSRLMDASLLPYSMGYLSIMKYALPLIGITSAFTGFLSGIRNTRIVMYTTLIPNAFNIVFNYIFIFGKLGSPAMGIRGAALGTVLANGIAVIILVSYLFSSSSIKPYRVFHFRKLDRKIIGKIISLSYPASIQNGGAFAIFLLYESMVGGLGTVYLASTHIVFNMFRINKTIVGGFARGASILAGNAMGTDDTEQASRIFVSMEKIAAVVGIAILVLVFLFPGAIVSIYTKDAETIATGMKALRFFAGFFFVEVLGFSLEIIFQNIGWSKYVLFSEFTTNVVFILAATWFFTQVLGMGIYSAWLSFGLYQLFHAFILSLGFFSGKWKSIRI